ncbi:aminotransferase class IV [Serpentinicella sp. ANB-PHB4]|uniref:aminotransferase class IV n=1 Tax=Serpentinicella sp. ANB-PHB4 TaxID=3074076 RepID=UPI002859CA1D|nr:aminotransferase class IV [Serpentinicella sp. ANB-PHB4]MDR5659793.1 aminotransferase class IV [Serpentinicella sp. ANB-PHB4]
MKNHYYILNSQPIQGFQPNLGESSNQKQVYEVIRVIDSVPLFVEEHLKRLEKSLSLINASVHIDLHQLLQDIHRLIEMNHVVSQNFKILVNNLDCNPQVYLFLLESRYPTKNLYDQGVHSILYQAERENPNAKMIQLNFREKINKKLKQLEAYEALLVNSHEEITEGSRSNLFFVKGSTLYTPPSENVLMGITRERILQLCNQLDIHVVEQSIHRHFLKEVDGLFLTGTSPKILPISSVDDFTFQSPTLPVIKKLIGAYDDFILQYIINYTK